jgi:hypothetical protein
MACPKHPFQEKVLGTIISVGNWLNPKTSDVVHLPPVEWDAIVLLGPVASFTVFLLGVV